MSKSANKTVPTDASVQAYLDAIDDHARRADCERIAAIMSAATDRAPKMWGAGIVGFGEYHYKYDSGREGDWCLTGFSSRKSAISLYIMPGFKAFDDLMTRLGKHKTGKSCLYVKRLSDIDEDVLGQLVAESVAWMRERYPTR